MIHNLVVEQAAVWIQECLLKTVDENAWCGGLYPDLGVDDAVMREGHEHLAHVRWVTSRMYPNSSEEVTSRVCKPENEKDSRCCQGNIDAVFYTRENGYDNCGDEDDVLERGNAPEPVTLCGRGDEIGDGVDNDSGERGRGNPEECGSETIQGDEDDDATEDTSRWGAHARLGLESRTRERTSSRISREDRPNGIGDTNRNKLLVRVDFVIIDTPES